nr:hypothetical protein [Tanacetum cinerariifolium]
MTLETHNWSSSAHQELYKIVKDENFPIVTQVDARVQNFEIQFLKEATKFVGDFKSLAKEADESLAKQKALELEIKRLLRAVVSQDIMSIVQNNSVIDTSDLQTELDRTKEHFKNCIIKKENEYAKLWNDWYKKCDECKYDKISYDKAYKNMQRQIKWLQAHVGDLKGKSKNTSGVLNTHNPLSQKLENETDSIRGTSKNTKFAKQSILGKPPMLGEIHSLSKPVTSNLVPTPQESKVMKNNKPRSNTKNDRVPSTSKSSRSKNKDAEVEEHHRNLLLSKNKKHISSACNNIKLDSQNVISQVVCAMCKQCLIFGNHDKLENENVKLEFQVLNYARENSHLKATYKNLFDSISVSRTQTKTIIASLQNELQSTIYKNAKLRTQLFKKVSDQNDNTHDTSANTKFAKQPIVENLSKVGETNALSKLVTSNSVSTPQESKGVNNDKVIASGMFRINPDKTSREAKNVPNSVRASNKTKSITVSQPHVITKKDVNSNFNGLSSTGVDNTKTRRPQPMSNTKHDRVPSASKSSQSKNKEAEVEEHHRNLLLSKNNKHISSACNNIKIDSQDVISKKQKAKVSFKENQMKYQPKVTKPKKVGILERLATPKPRKPRFLLRWSPTGRLFDQEGKIVDSSKSESQSDCSNGCSKHMTGNLKILINFVWKFMGTVRFRNDHVAAILGVDLLKGDHLTNLYTINLHEMASASPICLMARGSFTKSWLWHQRLSHLNFDTINDLAKNDLVSGLPKFKYHKEHLCPSCEQVKSKRASHPPKPVPNSRQRLHLLHMDLCGPMRIASIYGKRYVLVIVDDYFRYTWNRRTPQQNGVVERRNRTLVEAARTMLIFSRAPLFLWAEAIATACFTQNRSIIHRRFNKTPYELINGRKPDISFLHVFGALCYPKNDHEDIRKLGAKGDIGFFIGLKPGLQSMTSGQINSGLDLTYAPSTITMQQPSEGELDLLFEAMYDDYIGGQLSATGRTVSPAQEPQVRQTSTESTTIADTAPTPKNSSSLATNIPITSHDVDELNSNAMVDGNTFVNPFTNLLKNVKDAMIDPAWIDSMQEELLQFKRLDSKYALEILKKYGMKSCDPVGTPIEIKDKLDLDQNGTPVDAIKYRSMIGALMYLTSSRPDIVHATCLCAKQTTAASPATAPKFGIDCK